MPYVMVPVPEEHVEEVMQFMLRSMARANQKPWDLDSVNEIWESSDEITRTLMSYVARASAQNTEVAEAEAAAAVQLSGRETAAIVREINEQARTLVRPNLMSRQPTTELLPNGRSMEKITITMDPEIAVLVQQVERDELTRNPPPGSTS